MSSYSPAVPVLLLNLAFLVGFCLFLVLVFPVDFLDFRVLPCQSFGDGLVQVLPHLFPGFAVERFDLQAVLWWALDHQALFGVEFLALLVEVLQAVWQFRVPGFLCRSPGLQDDEDYFCQLHLHLVFFDGCQRPLFSEQLVEVRGLEVVHDVLVVVHDVVRGWVVFH